MAGEKYLNRDAYYSGVDNGDNECLYIGDNPDVTRFTGTEQATLPPQRDRAGYENVDLYGSATSGVDKLRDVRRFRAFDHIRS